MASADSGVDLSKESLGQNGLSDEILREMSRLRGEPDWMLDFRLLSRKHFEGRPRPTWGGDTSALDLDDISFSYSPVRTDLAGVDAQHESRLVHHRNRQQLEAQGVVFCDMATAVNEYPQLVKEHFGTVIPLDDNKYSALNSTAWSDGSFIYVPPGVEVEMPLQAPVGVDAGTMGQFERTLIIADEGSALRYLEGCSAPTYSSDPLRCAVVEVVVKPSARVTYTAIQNWSDNVFNLVTKRALVHAEGHMEWIDANLGSKLTMQYPSVVLAGPKASGEVLSVAYAGANQHQDTGAKMIHAAPETTSNIVTKSISQHGGRTSYRGLVRVEDHADGCKAQVHCDALILDDASNSDTYPCMEIGCGDAVVSHEATVARVSDDPLFYLQSRGLTEQQARGLIVNGFIEPVTRAVPLEYAVEWSRLIELQLEGSVG